MASSQRRIKPASQKAAKEAMPKQSSRPRRIRAAVSSASHSLRHKVNPNDKPKGFIKRFFGRLTRIVIPRFFREAWAELKLVTWPNRRETIKLTTAVIIFAVIFGSLVALTDYGLDKVFRQLLDL